MGSHTRKTQTLIAVALYVGVGVRVAHAAPGDIFNLGTLGGTHSNGHAINDAGQVAGASSKLGDAAGHAFRYSGTPGSGGAMVDLGTLGGVLSEAFGINDAGFVVGYAERSAAAGGSLVATLCQTDAANTAVDLEAWLNATNPTLGAFWRLTVAQDINNNGLITGWGAYDDGPGGLSDGVRAYILDASSLVPEPSGLALLGLALPALLRRREGRCSPAVNTPAYRRAVQRAAPCNQGSHFSITTF